MRICKNDGAEKYQFVLTLYLGLQKKYMLRRRVRGPLLAKEYSIDNELSTLKKISYEII